MKFLGISFKDVVELIKLAFKLPFSDPKSYLTALFVLPLVVLIFAFPILLLGLLFGFGFQFSLYIGSLWNTSSNDTKLTVIVAVILAILGVPSFIQLIYKFLKRNNSQKQISGS